MTKSLPEYLPDELNVEGFTNEEILAKFPNETKHLISELWLNGNIGLYSGHMKIINLYDFQMFGDRACANGFTLSIPYAGNTICWEIMFSSRDSKFLPDFIFNDDGFLSNVNLVKFLKTNVPSWANWNSHNSKSLLNLIKEFMDLYKKYQISKLSENEKFSRINFEYVSLVEQTDISAQDVQTSIETNDVVHVLINLPLDFSSLPPLVNGEDVENPGPDFAVLLVTFYQLNGSRINPQLRLSPGLEQVLAGSRNKFVPPFPTLGCLMDYVPEVCRMLAERINAVAINYKMKTEYITHLLLKYSCCLVEYDALTFSKISMIFEKDNFHWMLVITLSNRFPEEKPNFLLRSAYHMVNDEPCTETVSEYPYSPRWTPSEMIQRSIEHMFDNICSFRNSSAANNQM